MVDGEGPTQVRRWDGVEVQAAFFHIMGEIVDLGVVRLEVQVFQKQHNALPFGIFHGSLQPLDGRRLARI